MNQASIVNYLTIDVEDYYQVSAFEEVVTPSMWDSMPSRVERNTQILLDMLDAFKTRATFFVVGWIAERHPNLVRSIIDRGHEIGCHSYLHRRVYTLTPAEFRDDTKKAKDILENICEQVVLGYRAPSYSITSNSLWALDILAALGFKYDSSVFPICHDIYGIPGAPRFSYVLPGCDIVELPISTARFLGRNIPVAGGGYFRLFPYWITRFFLRKINREDKRPFVFYLHPWEVDPGQPRFSQASPFSRFRHYNNLNKTAGRFRQLLQDFSFGAIPHDGGMEFSSVV